MRVLTVIGARPQFIVSGGLQKFANYAQIISGAAMTGAMLGTILL